MQEVFIRGNKKKKNQDRHLNLRIQDERKEQSDNSAVYFYAPFPYQWMRNNISLRISMTLEKCKLKHAEEFHNEN